MMHNRPDLAGSTSSVRRQYAQLKWLLPNDADQVDGPMWSDTASGAAAYSSSWQLAAKNELAQLVAELREQNFDSIRFATYRAACKLRFVQKKANLHLVDIWNIIESFRENGLNAVESTTLVKISRVELLLSTVYHNLNKRLPVAQHIDTDKSIALLLSFLLGAYDREDSCRLSVFSIKIACATLCAGKLVDKLRYVFSQISDNSGLMIDTKFDEYLQQVLALTTAVFEGPTFGYTSELAVRQCFPPHAKVTVNQFLDILMSDPCPACLMWLPLLHRMASVSKVFHPVTCDACQTRSFTGFRYKCQRCSDYQLCQECFWRGRTSANHTNQHEMKEYSSYKSPTKQLTHSIHKSLRCVPAAAHQLHPIFPERPDRPLDLSNVVPITPSLAQQQMRIDHDDDGADWMMTSQSLLPAQYAQAAVVDDEHKLIARYSAKLAGRTTFATGGDHHHPMNTSMCVDKIDEDSANQRAMIARLEQENREMMREIAQIQAMQASADGAGIGSTNELDGLRERKAELETRMNHMQQTRRQLMAQLEHLMRVLKTSGSSREGSPRSLTGIGGDVRSAFRDSPPTAPTPIHQQQPHSRAGSLPAGIAPKSGTLQGDLLNAADNITKNMSSLVQELDDDDEDADDGGHVAQNGFG